MTQLGEAALIAAFRKSRDASVFDELYRNHNPALYAMAVRITGDSSLAQDVVHDAWLRCIQHLDRFEGRSSFRTWATGILINRIREIWRRESRDPGADSARAVSSEMPALPHEVDPLDLEQAIARLPAGFRQALILHDVEGFTHEEIGVMLGIATGTSKSQLARARQRLRELLSEVPR